MVLRSLTLALLASATLALLFTGSLELAPARDAAPDAKAALDKLGTSRGLCVVLGDGDLAVELARKSDLQIYVQAPSPEEAATARRAADAAGFLGSRITVQQGKLDRLHLADDLADAVLVTQAAAGVSKEELLRVLRPEGKAHLPTATLVKPVPANIDEWTHPYHGPDNNPQSNDKRARRPYLTHFLAEPWYCPLGQMTVASGGRLFKVFGDRSSAKPQEALMNTLLAVNAYNGTILWKRDLMPGFMIHRNTLIATPQTLYLADAVSCKLIDAATGKLKDEIVVPEKLSDGPVWKWMALEGGVLYALVGEKEGSDQALKSDRLRGAGWPWWSIKGYGFAFGRTLLAIDPATKKILWYHKEEEQIDSRGVCLKNGRLYFYSDRKFLACLDGKTGKVAWKNTDKELLDAIGAPGAAQHWMLGFASTAYMKCSDDALFFAGPQRPRLVAASTKDGKLLWQHPAGNVQLIVRDDGLYALGEGRPGSAPTSLKLEPLTGKVLATFASRDRCTRATGCADSIFTRGGAGGSTSVFDVTAKEPKVGVVSPMRPACQDGVVVANGYLYWGPWMCRCDLTQLGIISLGSGGSFNYTANATDAERLQRGAADSKLTPLPVTAADWPTYRKDNARSTVAAQTIPAKVGQPWEYKPAGRFMATAPVTAGGLVFVSGSDGAVRALDARTGKERWTTYTGGPVLYPPSIAQDRAYVGSGDGWVYCLEAATGKQLWRFRAAPAERVIPVYGSLSSTWPVGSGVLVDKGVAYAAAGIANYDGTHVFALDAATGSIRWQNHTSGDTGRDLPDGGVSVQGPFILHNQAIHMPAGNRPTMATYALADGKFSAGGGARGKDIYLRNNQVRAAGYPLYWRQEDDHFLSPTELETPAGTLALDIAKVARLAPQADPKEKPTAVWSAAPFNEIAAVAVGKNAVVVAGLERQLKQPDQVECGLCALSLEDGKQLWKVTLPSQPVRWGLAIDQGGRIIVTLQDGRVMGFAGE